MNEKTFWGLTAHIDKQALAAGDGERAVAPLRNALCALPERDIEGYHELLAKMLYRIDGEVYAQHAGENGESGDAFLYARCHVVAGGKDRYDRVAANPALMPASLDDWFEELLYASSQAWAEKTGGDAEEWEFDTALSYETGSNTAAWPNVPAAQEADPFDRRLDRAVTWAGQAFKNREFDTVVKLLERHEQLLSKKQTKMLRESRAALAHSGSDQASRSA